MRKSKVLVTVLVLSLFCSGTIVATADTRSSKIAGHSVMAETTLSSTNGSALCRTVSSSYDVETLVEGIYVYHNNTSGQEYTITAEDYGYYGSELIFSLPSGNYVVDYARAYHTASCETETWYVSTYDSLE